MTDKLAELLKLSVGEKLEIIDALWDSIGEPPNAFRTTEEMKAELDRRGEEFLKNPDSGMTWEQVEASIQGRKSKPQGLLEQGT
jgi:putative addiction module component (TIGR02574 family)